ncbi:MAG: DNA-binding protein [Comamonadaceae bacterium]|nr:MAG: DNA-binding protein [Comamonadaceae bacterium]
MSTPYVDGPIAAPAASPENTAFWDAAREHRLMVKFCTSCNKAHWYPRALCPYCLGDTEWKQASGRGTIYSYSVTRRAGPTPFCIAYVTLEEGTTMMTNIVDCDLDEVRIGQNVEVVFKPTEEGQPPVPMFKPVA